MTYNSLDIVCQFCSGATCQNPPSGSGLAHLSKSDLTGRASAKAKVLAEAGIHEILLSKNIHQGHTKKICPKSADFRGYHAVKSQWPWTASNSLGGH